MIPHDLKQLGSFFGWVLAAGALISNIWGVATSAATWTHESEAAIVLLLALLIMGALTSAAVLVVRLIVGWTQRQLARYLVTPLSLACMLNILMPIAIVLIV